MTTQVLTTCDGKINNHGFCDKCYQPAHTTSSYCGRLLPIEQLQKHNVMESLPPETTGYIVYHNDKVNSILGAALRCLSTEELCVLRDCLIRRTPPNEGGNAP